MKQTIILTGPELQAAVEREIVRRFPDKHLAMVSLIADPEEARAELRIRAQVIVFDTLKAAREYPKNPDVLDPAPKEEEQK